MIYALSDGRTHVRINAARALGVKGEAAARAVANLGLACRDSIAQVRREAAKALGKLGGEALPAVPDLVGALSDVEAEVAEAAAETLEPLGARARDGLWGWRRSTAHAPAAMRGPARRCAARSR